jgi:metal-responsive CopG/Arc/MetJ family transcriptional regulator
MVKKPNIKKFLLSLPFSLLQAVEAEAGKASTSVSEMIRRMIGESLTDKASTEERVYIREGENLVPLKVNRRKLRRLVEPTKRTKIRKAIKVDG